MFTKQGNNRHNIHLKFTSAARLYRSTPRLTCLNFKFLDARLTTLVPEHAPENDA